MNDVPSWLWGLLAALLFLSGLFSSSETALFSLGAKERRRAGPTVKRLIERPSQLLVSVLLCNLVVNVLFFAFAGRLLPRDNGWGDVTVGLGVLVALLIFGEILPKTFGLRAKLRLARTTAPILLLAVLVLGPLTRPLRRLLDWTNGTLSLWLAPERGITAETLARVMERGEEEGALLAEEADLLAEVIELDDIRVREIMTPRVDAVFLDLSEKNREEVVAAARERRLTWLPVVDGSSDNVVGRVHLRDLLRSRERPVTQLVMPVKFVPEVASALDLLHSLRDDRTSEAVVVDEWGGTAGFVTAEDVFEELVGDLRTEDEPRSPSVVPLGEGRYRVPGHLAIRDWNDAFGLAVVPIEFETVGGFVTALLGRIPRAGDEVSVGDLEMEVHSMRGRRVAAIDIGVRAARPAGAAQGPGSRGGTT